ncbi:MAG: flagellin [Candidatus Sumerlaeia bacterium]|nr:flagellin [Candidatus Sumerlaeia bacterium]
MALTVNSNITSLNAQRNLQQSTMALGKALERLSSGLRINRAGDDAAGLAISENLRAQVRGLRQAVRNAGDGLSLVGTAEGALNETTNIIQRIRELAIQAANGTNSDANRDSIQNEVNQLIDELDRIGNTTQFNGRNLLDGSFSDVVLHVGANQNQTLSVSIGDVRASSLGAVATVDGNQIATAVNSAADLADLSINGVAIDDPVVADDVLSTAQRDASAISLAAAINRASGQTKVYAEVLDTVVTGGAIAGGTLNSTNYVEINGVRLQGATLANDTDSALRQKINAVSNQTGVVASLNGSNQLVLTAEDGRNIEIVAAGTGATITGLAAEVYHGNIRLVSNETFSVAGADAADAGFGITSYTVDVNTAINRVNVTTAEGAQTAIRTTDHALTQLNLLRSDLGAITNRLEATISNLQATAENLSASESRIRDADFAQETAALTRAQILQQAGVSILAQANLVPQAALSLLQR